MKKVVIIGGACQGVKAAEAIRKKDEGCSIQIILESAFLPHQPDRLLDFLAGRIKEKGLLFKDKDFYERGRIEVLFEKDIAGLNMSKKKVLFKDQDFCEFDELVVATGSVVKLPDLKGVSKEGVVALDGPADVKRILENLSLVHTVIVVGCDQTALETARIIAEQDVDVKLLGPFDYASERLEVIRDEVITEIIGEGEVKALRLSNNKVLGASVVIFTGPREPHVAFLKDTALKIHQGVVVDAFMRTSHPCIFAVGDAAEFLDQTDFSFLEDFSHEDPLVLKALCQSGTC